MTTILAIDAAWTANEPSGVALIKSSNSAWRCVAIAPSYDSFHSLANGIPVQWVNGPFIGAAPNIPRLLQDANKLAGADVGLITVDMPMSTVQFTGRRAADNLISIKFGSQGCSTHSPTHNRPGQLGRTLMQNLISAGYPLANTTTPPGTLQRTVEVYPHPALLTLMDRKYRIPYKINKSTRYWPNRAKDIRKKALLAEFTAIDAALEEKLGPTGVPLHFVSPMVTFSQLKRFEDTIDAIICGWIGTCYVATNIVPYGDNTATIWNPS